MSTEKASSIIETDDEHLGSKNRDAVNTADQFRETSATNDQDDSDSLTLERSYEILTNNYKIASMDINQSSGGGGDDDDGNGDMTNNRTNASLDQSTKPEETDSEPRYDKSNSNPRKNSFQTSIKKSSTSFLSKLQSSSSSSSIGNSNDGPTNTSTNLPSSLANALSSISSFTSSFSLGSSSNDNSNSNNNGNTGGNVNNLTIDTASTSTLISQTSETREQILTKKAALERKNLINLTKLIVKDLISSSLVVNRTIDECHSAIHLNNYFTLIDRVLKHGLKQNILSNKSASLWSALDNLPKYLSDKRLTSETVRSLAHTKTPDGKIKAWLRIAMMQKKLPEYFNEILANKNVLLKDIYYDYAFMMNDEAQVFAGLIIGVNVIDCNFFVKDDNFDSMDEVIDLSPYLKTANSFDEDATQEAESDMVMSKDGKLENLTAVLDQKNYLEERSSHLESTIASLHSKIKQLEEQNSRLEIDAKVNEVRIQKLQKNQNEVGGGDKLSSSTFPIPEALKGLISTSTESKKSNLDKSVSPEADSAGNNQQSAKTDSNLAGKSDDQSASKPVHSGDTSTLSSEQNDESKRFILEDQKSILANLEKYQNLSADQAKELTGLRERVGILETSYRDALEKIRVLERDLDIQTSMNKDREMTIKIYEKDLREKASQVESLRSSLADAKKVNSELNERLSDTNNKLKERLNSITNLQASLDRWKLENKSLANRLHDKQTALKSVNGELEKAMATMNDLKKYNEKINDDLKKERECGQSSSITVEAQNSRITELNDQLKIVERELEELRPNREKLKELKKRCQEYELSLEEVGYQLRESRLEVESLKENSSVFLDSQWMDSKQVKNCALCHQSFSVTRRKHHCRLCGNVFCQTCSDNKMELASSSKPARVCDTCHAFLLAKFVKSSSSSGSGSASTTTTSTTS